MSDHQEEVADYHDDEDCGNNAEQVGVNEDMEPEQFDQTVLEMDEELEKLSKMQQQVEQQITSASDKMDENSIYVGQVDYDATPEELRAHFAPCGTINRITIMCDKITGHPKGFSYIEFMDKDAVENALKLDESMFKGRQLKVLPKRQNTPSSFIRGGGRGAGRGGRVAYGAGPVFAGRGRGGRGAGRGWARGSGPVHGRGGFPGRAFRGGRGGHTPYY